MKISKEVKVGILVTGAVAALLWGMNYLKGVDVFSGINNYYAVYTQVDGLTTSSEIILNGVKIGQVQKIEFIKDNSGRILATLAVNSDVFIGKQSIARITSSDLLGGRIVNIVLDSASVAAEDGDTLHAEVATTLSDQVMPLKDKAERLITSLDSLALALKGVFNPGTQKNLNSSFANLDKTLASIERASAGLDQLVASDDSKLRKMISNLESITANIKNNNESLSNALKNISLITDSLAKSNLASTINNANLTLKETASIMDKINRGEGTMGMLINNYSLYNALEKSAVDLDNLLVDLKQNPKRYVHISV
nr:MlaD family protein [Bacteroidia bacterium]